VDVHKGEEGPAHVDACGQGEGVKNLIFCGCHKWMAPIIIRCAAILSFYTRSMDKKICKQQETYLRATSFQKMMSEVFSEELQSTSKLMPLKIHG